MIIEKTPFQPANNSSTPSSTPNLSPNQQQVVNFIMGTVEQQKQEYVSLFNRWKTSRTRDYCGVSLPDCLETERLALQKLADQYAKFFLLDGPEPVQRAEDWQLAEVAALLLGFSLSLKDKELIYQIATHPSMSCYCSNSSDADPRVSLRARSLFFAASQTNPRLCRLLKDFWDKDAYGEHSYRPSKDRIFHQLCLGELNRLAKENSEDPFFAFYGTIETLSPSFSSEEILTYFLKPVIAQRNFLFIDKILRTYDLTPKVMTRCMAENPWLLNQIALQSSESLCERIAQTLLDNEEEVPSFFWKQLAPRIKEHQNLKKAIEDEIKTSESFHAESRETQELL